MHRLNMHPSAAGKPNAASDCHCAALRQAARHVTQFYDELMAPVGLRISQYSVLARLERLGPQSVNALAALMVMDRTTVGRNVLPLERDGLVAIRPSPTDRRAKELSITAAGRERYRAGRRQWQRAQAGFEARFGAKRAAELRAVLRDVVSTEFTPEA